MNNERLLPLLGGCYDVTDQLSDWSVEAGTVVSEQSQEQSWQINQLCKFLP
jgi:hypothetical protein